MDSRRNQIEQLRDEIKAKEQLLKSLENEVFDVFGEWEVSTEGDVEGRSTNKLGRHKGNIFDIAKQLHNQSFYALSFKRVGYIKESERKPQARSVHFNVEDTTIKLFDQDAQLKKLNPNLPEGCKLSKSNYFGSVKLEWVE